MYTHDQFATSVAKHFEFLETDYGMRREAIRAAGKAAWIVYANIDVKVTIEQDTAGSCGVTVQNLRYVQHDPLERSEFDLEEIVKLSGTRPPRQSDQRSGGGDPLAKTAEVLKTVGASVLKGDFAALHARQLKIAEAMRRHNPPPPK